MNHTSTLESLLLRYLGYNETQLRDGSGRCKENFCKMYKRNLVFFYFNNKIANYWLTFCETQRRQVTRGKRASRCLFLNSNIIIIYVSCNGRVVLLKLLERKQGSIPIDALQIFPTLTLTNLLILTSCTYPRFDCRVGQQNSWGMEHSPKNIF